MAPLLHTDGLSVGYGTRKLVREAGVHLNAGELTALLGVNGVGKSTLLRALCGLQAPLNGKVFVAGDELYALSASERARKVSVVLTGRPPTGSLDVETLVALGRQPWTSRWGAMTAADTQAVELALERVGGKHLRNKSLATCSDGECQKVLIARALAQATPALLLDEPTAFLDLPNRADIVRMLRTIAQQDQKAILFSTHDLQLALDLCDRIVLLRHAEQPWQGTPQEALTTGLLERVFAGSGIRFDTSNGTHRFVR
jgi:iron complex transport system ATP-binding protein